MDPISNPRDMIQAPPPMPIAAQPLEYVHASNYRRPGIITAIGVMSIIVASLAMMFNLLWLLQTFGFFMMRTAMTQFGTGPTVVLSTGQVKPEDEFVGTAGLSKAQRQEAMFDVAAKAILTPPREKQMNALLAEHGKLFTAVNTPTGGKEDVDLAIMKAEQVGEGPEGAARDILTLETGSIEISDNDAAYLPASGPVLRVAGGGAALSPRQVQSVVDFVNTTNGTPMNPQQAAALTAALQAPDQKILAPSLSMLELLGQINYSLDDGNGVVTILTDRGSLDIDTNGVMTNNLISAAPPTVASTAATPPMLAGFDLGAIILSGAVGVLSLMLAILLLVAGILTLRQSHRARLLHRIYIWIKIPAALIAAAATGWLYYELFSVTAAAAAMATPGGGAVITANFTSPMLILPVIVAALGLFYPLALLITFSTRTVRSYYSAGVASS